MTAKVVVPRQAAHRDVDEAIDHYLRQAGGEIALRFVDAIERTYRAIGERPAAGSPRYAHELDLPGLRHRAVGHFPHRVFYVEREDHIDVWRVLDGRRDIPAWLAQFE
jgi:toxin ParE1/3/4